jgi:hypothetical protein
MRRLRALDQLQPFVLASEDGLLTSRACVLSKKPKVVIDYGAF